MTPRITRIVESPGGHATDTGSSLKEVAAFGLTHVHPFGRRGDMFGAAFNYSEPSASKHDESVFESFYRPRLTQSMDLGPDIEGRSIHSRCEAL